MTQPQTIAKYEASYTGLQKRAINDKMFLVDPIDTPVIDHFGFSTGDIVNFPNNAQIEWISDTYRTLTGTLGHAATIATDATAITGATTSQFKVGDLVKIDSEIVYVSAVDSTDREKATVTRAQVGTTAATHNSIASYTIVDSARVEGADTTFGVLEDPSTHLNYVQTIQDAIKVTRHAAQMRQWGIDDEFQYQVNKKTKELMRELERSFFYHLSGQKRTSAVPGQLAGFRAYITNNTFTTTSANLTIGNIQDVLYSIYLDGGAPNVAVCNPAFVKTLTNLYQSSNYLRVERGETARGMKSDRIVSDWGELTLLQGRNVPSGEVYFLQDEYIKIIEADPFGWYDVPRGGDYVATEIIGDYSLMVMNGQLHGFLLLT